MILNRDALAAILDDLAELPEAMEQTLGQARPESVRHFDQHERDALTPAALGYLLELQRCEAIDRDELELVIHSIASHTRPPLDRRDLSEIIDQLLLGIAWTDVVLPTPLDRAH